ncbi:peptidylprolyl isomerase [Pseudanabaena sp. ABRG5-3]|uniref:peptidylprolyl isomerase n=1 Tax=Pseudanabaena sp. ABRG5-3 TaxID=685565 RepID=UPI000DC6D7F6|nr:peptidylprolyl isomerase [Pseudanabaena sp. ABRG5-3]BBC23582.1 peptidyl-prolyl cis-trans isomerase cyclophilin type [Pseudanabaena sp. ABRG5-3]
MFRWIFSCFLAISILLTSCSNSSSVSASASPSASASASVSSTAKASPTKVADASPSASPNSLEAALAKYVQLKGKATVELKLKSGTVKIELDGTNAPLTAGNFADLVKRGLYNGLTFHRVVKEPTPFVAQGGDPLGNGTGNFVDPVTSQTRYIPLEILPEGDKQPVYGEILPPTQKPKLRHNKGAIAMARSQSPNSASCQFYIALDDIYFLDGSYAVFGYVTDGMELVEKIQVGDRIESITITQGEENIKQPV